MTSLRIAHVGNIANNAFLNAQFQRRLAAREPERYGHVEADSYDTGGGALMCVPQWDAGDFDARPEMGAKWFAWSQTLQRDGTPWRRPTWAKILGNEGGEPWYLTQEAFEADLGRLLPLMVDSRATVCPDLHLAELGEALAGSRLTPEEQRRALPYLRDDTLWWPVWELAKSGQHDLFVLYGPFASAGCVLPRDVPYITFEHGTMRYVPWLREAIDVELTLAYQHADHNLITNTDCFGAAELLGLDPDRVSWTPHPVDEERFVPRVGPPPPPKFEHMNPIAVLDFFCPARQGFLLKGTEHLLYGFEGYVAQMAQGTVPPARLTLVAGGDDYQGAERLVDALGLREHVSWIGALPKARLLERYQQADVVLDQFTPALGSYGTCVVEALACGKPVVTWVDSELHARVEAVCPNTVVLQALNAENVTHRLVVLAQDPAMQAYYGKLGRNWVEQQHGWHATAAAHVALYEQVLASHE